MSIKKPKYSQEFRKESVELLLSSGKSANAIAVELGCSPSSLNKWKRDLCRLSDENTTSDLEAINVKLKRDLDRVRKENEILKKAAAFFAKESL